MQRFQVLLLPIFEFVHDQEELKEPYVPIKSVTHRDLLELLKTGNPEIFRNAMRLHLDPPFHRIL